MKSSVTRALLPAVAAALLAAGVQAQGPRPGRWGQHLTPASEATRSLGHLVRPLAARHRRSTAAMRALLARDRDLWLDPQARLVYQCEPKLPAPAAARSAIEAEALAAPPYAPEETFRLHSRPSASRKIFLDFDGHTTSGTWWNDDTNGAPIVSEAFDTDGSATFGAAEVEAIQQVWQRVAEDYAPFDVDVTTEDPGVDGLRRTSSSDQNFGVRVVISPTDGWFGNSGGVAYLSVFSMINTGSDLPAFVFSANLSNNERNIAEAASHEAGHTLGLGHDGKSGSEYFTGNSGSDWAPIMGAGYYKNVTHWSRGEYSGATQTQDDYALMQQNGALFRADDHGSSAGTATALAGSNPAASGVIEQRTDRDFFQFTTGAGSITLSAGVGPRGPNLDLKLELYDASGALVTSADPAGLPATLTRTVAAGTYYVAVDGVGVGDPLSTGYSDYGSLGQYTLGASLVPASTAASFTVNSPNGGESWQAGSIQNLTWSSSGVSGNVKLEYSLNNGSTWTVINANAANDGAEGWTVPAGPTSQARVRISSVDAPSVTDISNAAFNIVSAPVASITVTSPNGGESWTVGSARTLTWSSSNVSGTVRIDYSTNAGSTWNPIAGSIANDGSESWTVPNTPSASVLIRVAATDGSASDASNSVFTIAGNPGDAYEPDDSPAAAKTISSGQTQGRSIHAAGNEDWVKIVLPSRLVTVLTTSGVAGGDTVLYLYSSNGATLLASNDNYNKKHRYSRLSKRLQAGTYYLRVIGKNNSTLSSYTLSLATKR